MTKHFAAQCNIHQITAAAAAQEAMLGGDEVNHAQLKRAFEGRPDMAAALFSGVLPVDYIEMEQVDWLVEPFLAKGKLNIVHGDAGVGKSFVLQSICAALSLGADPTALVRRGAFNLAGKPQKALYCSVEADAATELRPRIEAMGGDPSKLLHIPADFPHVNTTQGRARIEGAIEAHKPALVIFDPITSFTKDLDPNSAADVRAALDPLSQMARTYDTCIVYLVHDKKVQGGKSQHKAGGSAQWVAAARAGFRAGQTQDGRKAIVLAKWNNASVCKACEYRIVSVLVMGANGEDIKTARLEWLGECDILPGDFEWDERKSGDKDGANKAERAETIIVEALKAGSKLSEEVDRAVLDTGISFSTLRNVKWKLGKDGRIRHHKAAKGKFTMSLVEQPSNG